MPSMSERFAPAADVVDTGLDDSEIALLDLATKTYFSLNSTGAYIWERLKEGLALGEISERLQREFDVSAEVAERSVTQLVEQLLGQKLVQRVVMPD